MTRIVPDNLDSLSRPRLASLDMLRGVAVLMVLMVHAPLPRGIKPLLADGPLGSAPLRFIRLGAYGVDLFFVLSGFLISGLLFAELGRTGTLNVPRFWMRRGLKIWPSYFTAYGLTVLFLCARDILTRRSDAQSIVVESLRNAVPNVFFIQNYVVEGRWFASWSLAIEEHFYLALPLLLLLMTMRKYHKIGVPLLCVVVCVLALGARIYAVSKGIESDHIYLQTHYRADTLCFGVLVGYLHHFHRPVFNKIPRSLLLMFLLFGLALAIPFCYPWGRGVTETIGLTLMSVCFGGIVAMGAAHPDLGKSSHLERPLGVLARIGIYSYTIYLCQWGSLLLAGTRNVDGLVFKIFHIRADWQDIVFLAASLGGGVILSHVVEKPFLSLREKWFPKESTLTARIG